MPAHAVTAETVAVAEWVSSWLITGDDPMDEETPRWDMNPRTPTKEEAEALKLLVAEVVRRRPPP
jgi:hypothetical protein